LAGVGGVDVFLVLRQLPVAAGLAVQAAASLRNLHRWAGSLVAVVGHDVHVRVVEGVEDAVFGGGAHVVPGRAGEAQISRPAGSAMTCTFTPWHLCFPE
jgi:hypothetical protein